MVHSCAAYNCVERRLNGSDISFHTFPKNDKLKKQWIIAIRRKNYKPGKSAKICSKHFTPDSFDTSGWSSKRKLKIDAVPSVFNFPSHLTQDQDIKTRKRPFSTLGNCIEGNENIRVSTEDKAKSNASSSLDASTGPPAKKKRLFYPGDYKESSSTDLKYRLTIKKVLTRKDNEIRNLKRRNQRLIKKISTLKSLVQHLKRH